MGFGIWRSECILGLRSVDQSGYRKDKQCLGISRTAGHLEFGAVHLLVASSWYANKAQLSQQITLAFECFDVVPSYVEISILNGCRQAHSTSWILARLASRPT